MSRPTRRQIRRRRATVALAVLLIVAGAIAAGAWVRNGGKRANQPPTTQPPRDEPASTTSAPESAVATGSFRVAPGGSRVVGSGPLHTYSVEVEAGIDVDPAAFAVAVDRILADPRGWTADGSVSLQRVDADDGPSFRVQLATPATTDTLCAPLDTQGTQSCRQGEHVVINLVRWVRGAAPSGLDLDDYRSYVVSHEVGHALGHDHVDCPGAGVPAPVMAQQTLGIGACTPNPWPFP